MLSSAVKCALKLFNSRALPTYEGSFYAQDVHKDSEILRDADGTPTCISPDEKSVFFLTGVCQGQDRLWQLHLSRMASSGRLCQIAGEKAIAIDLFMRQINLRKLAEGDWKAICEAALAGDPEACKVKSMVTFYAKGVNWAVNNAKQLPVEFHLTGQRPFQLWTEVDSLSVLRLHAFAMGFGYQHSLVRQALHDVLGDDIAKEWTMMSDKEQEDIPDTVPPNDSQISELLSKADVKTAMGPEDRERDHNFECVLHLRKMSASSMPILASDPHLSVRIPSFWYPINMHCTESKIGFSSAGACVVGMPGIFIGHNTFCSWGVTLGYQDMEDVYIEKVKKLPNGEYEYLSGGKWLPVKKRTATIKIKGKPSQTRTFLETHHGPIVSYPSIDSFQRYKAHASEIIAKASEEMEGKEEDVKIMLSLAATTLRPQSRGPFGIYRVLRARSFKEFDVAIGEISRTAGLNFGYADIDGHIGYVLAGEVPIRKCPRGKELYPLKGWSGEDEYIGFLPHANLPKSLDPSKGYVISANHKIVNYNDYKHYLGTCWKVGWRAASIEKEILEAVKEKKTLDSDDCLKIQLSNLSIPAIKFCAVIEKFLPDEKSIPETFSEEERKLITFGIEHLKGFNGRLDLESTQATLYGFAHGYLVKTLTEGGMRKALENKEVSSKASKIKLNSEALEGILIGEPIDVAKAFKIIMEFEGHLHLNVLRMFNRDNSYWIQQSGGPVNALSKALLRAVKTYNSLPQKEWGDVHAAALEHKLTAALKQPPGTAFDHPKVRLAGDMNTPNQNKNKGLTELEHNGSSVSMRFIADMSDLRNKCRFITPVGVCAIVGSPFYTNRVQRWGNGIVPRMIWHQDDARKVSKFQMKFDLTGPPNGFSLSFLGAVAVAGLASVYALRRRR